jgi:hypothetical protein
MKKASIKTVAGDFSFAKDGEWAKARMDWTQVQNAQPNNLDQFRDGKPRPIVWPPEAKTGTLIYPMPTRGRSESVNAVRAKEAIMMNVTRKALGVFALGAAGRAVLAPWRIGTKRQPDQGRRRPRADRRRGRRAGKMLLAAIEIWRDDVNAKAGCSGRPVEVVSYDDQSTPSNVPASTPNSSPSTKSICCLAPTPQTSWRRQCRPSCSTTR